MLEAILFIVGGILFTILWFKVQEMEDDVEVRVGLLETRNEIRRDEINVLRDAHAAKLKECRESARQMERVLDKNVESIGLLTKIFTSLISTGTFEIVETRPRKRRKTVKRRKR